MEPDAREGTVKDLTFGDPSAFTISCNDTN